MPFEFAGIRTITKVGSVAKGTIKFSVSATTIFGQNVYVSGNIPQLGSWNLSQALLLSPDAYPTWKGTITAPLGTTVSYKYVRMYGPVTKLAQPEGLKAARVQWLDGPNLSVTPSASENPVSYNWK
ncbi:carbohydrate-binding module family 20 domain-containing protein [Candidatus Finniella inopinata]|uniref:carbohydrate-binding module family 20 domain-containing protein n=1 Tax=Candidatus Finniella inopinata TaxID=1696036 RepID=UPI0013EE7F3B|nr:carbohydrate-binding module family 20 domain-containing protein [Candidatus Finniella inopinata]